MGASRTLKAWRLALRSWGLRSPWRQAQEYSFTIDLSPGVKKRWLSRFPLSSFPHRCSLSRTSPPLTSPQRGQVLLYVVAVQLGAAEQDGLVHAVRVDGSHKILCLEEFHSLRKTLYGGGKGLNKLAWPVELSTCGTARYTHTRVGCC